MTYPLMHEGIWFDQWRVSDAEKLFYENQAQLHAPLVIEGSTSSTSSCLVNEIARARQHIKQSLQNDGRGLAVGVGVDTSIISHRLDKLEHENSQLRAVTKDLQSLVSKMESRIAALEPAKSGTPVTASTAAAPPAAEDDDDDDDDIDLFGSDDDDEEAEKLKQERLKAYQEKKAKKPGPIAKSNVILDVKPWDDETDMALVEKCVRSITMDGLLLGASRLVPVGYGIKKLQISCVVVDDLVSTDDLQEKIESFEDYIQSCDIAAFNKV